MCGIAGIVEQKNSRSTIDQALLKRMSDVIVHRGPDSDGQWASADRRCGLAFRRLSIIDLSEAGNQPMSTPDGRYTIIFNGEIYNHMEIRSELESRGCQYRSRTDTETILYGYREFGKEILRKMRGMWAFAIWDAEKKELFCARDRIGIKPLYFTNQNGRFIFGSEIKSIMQHPAASPELSLAQLPNYLNFGMSGNRESLFEGIRKVPAGHFLLLKADGEFELERYWSPFEQAEHYSTLGGKEVQSEILRILRAAVDDRMMSDVPFGVFLSGGIDSSLNVALMHELMDRPIDTYSVGFKELEKYNELGYARKVANLFETNHREILIDSNDAMPILEDLVWHEDEPNADPVCMPLWFLSKLTRDSGTTVIQVGEGSDEQFVGYKWMMFEYNFYRTWWRYFNSLPAFVRKLKYNLAKPLFLAMNQELALDYLRRGAAGDELYWSGRSIFSPTHMNGLLDKRHRHMKSIPAEYGAELHRQALAFRPKADYLQRIEYVELQNRLAELLLMRVDKIGMAHSIEARVPFLDHRLVEFTMSLPPEIKTPGHKITKYILKEAINGLLPDEIIHRKKQGFWAPVNEWLRREWKGFSTSAILDSPLVKEKILDKTYIENLIRSHAYTGKRGLEIFTLLTLSLWWKKWMP